MLESPTVAPIVIRAGQAMESGDFDRAVEFYAAAYQRTPWNTRLRDALVAAYVARAAQTRTQTRFRDLERAERDLRAALELALGTPASDSARAVLAPATRGTFNAAPTSVAQSAASRGEHA